MPLPTLPTRAAAVLALAGLLSAGCSAGAEEFDSNRNDPTPGMDLVVRTPVLPSAEQPTDAPLVQELPGATGGVPGSPDAEPPPASPGEDSDSG